MARFGFLLALHPRRRLRQGTGVAPQLLPQQTTLIVCSLMPARVRVRVRKREREREQVRERAREPLRRRGRVPCAGGGRARGPYALTRWLPPRRSASCARALRAAACSCSCAGRGRWPLRFGTCKTGSGHMFWRAVMWCIYSAAGRGRSPLRPRRGRAARCVMDSPNAMRSTAAGSAAGSGCVSKAMRARRRPGAQGDACCAPKAMRILPPSLIGFTSK